MYDEAWENRSDPGIELAKLRVRRILQQQVVASIRTLESKISESGRGAKPAPHLINNALRQLTKEAEDNLSDQASEDAEPVVKRLREPHWPCEMFHLSATDPATVADAMAVKLPLERAWHIYARKTGTDSIGAVGETIVRKAFESSPEFYVGPSWGDVKGVNGKSIPSDPGPIGSVDGLVFLSHLPPAQGSAIVEVKNKREWIYPRDTELWDIIRNGFAVDAVPIIFARKIYSSSMVYVLARLGGIGIQMHAQFAPASAEPTIRMAKDKNGLGFKDLDFSETVPRNLRNALPLVASQIVSSRERMEQVRDLAEPHLNNLASENVPRPVRRQSYNELQAALDKRFGRGG